MQKPQFTKQKPSQKHQQHQALATCPLSSLPSTQFPSPHNRLQFYKTYQRHSQQFYNSHIGVLIYKFSRAQQDYLYYFTQLLASRCSYLKVFVVEPNLLYFQMNMLRKEWKYEGNQYKQNKYKCQQQQQQQQQHKQPYQLTLQQIQQYQQQQNLLQHNILKLLTLIKQEIFIKFMRQYLSSSQIMNLQFDENKLEERFISNVVEKIQSEYEKIFTVKKKK